MKECTIITSIHPANSILKEFADRKSDLIIVGDRKSPASYDLDCEYLDIKAQNSLYSDFSELLPENHYSRKNMGYIHAVINGYERIYDTDDDNAPLFKEDIIFDFKEEAISGNRMINVYKLYTDDEIWSRGFPHRCIKEPNSVVTIKTTKKPSIVYGLCDGDTDVDAIFRIINPVVDVSFSGIPLVISNKNIIVFNSQSTFWVDPEMFVCMYLPVTVTSRFSDILRSYVTQHVLRAKDKHLGVNPYIAFQVRNKHNVYNDLQEELFMYENVDKVIKVLTDAQLNGTASECLYQAYNALCDANIVTQQEMRTLGTWIKIIDKT